MSDVNERLAAAPELHRARAQNSANLLLTASAAVAAGVVFGSPSTLPFWSQFLLTIAVALLILAACIYFAVGVQELRGTSPTSETSKHLRSLGQSMVRRTQVATYIAGLGAVAFVFSLILLLVHQPQQGASVDVELNLSAAEALKDQCYKLDEGTFSAEVDLPASLSTSSVLALSIEARECGSQAITYYVNWRDVVTLTEQDS